MLSSSFGRRLCCDPLLGNLIILKYMHATGYLFENYNKTHLPGNMFGIYACAPVCDFGLELMDFCRETGFISTKWGYPHKR